MWEVLDTMLGNRVIFKQDLSTDISLRNELLNKTIVDVIESNIDSTMVLSQRASANLSHFYSTDNLMSMDSKTVSLITSAPLNIDREMKMVQKIHELFIDERQNNILIAVGLAHVVQNESALAILEKQYNYKFEPVPLFPSI